MVLRVGQPPCTGRWRRSRQGDNQVHDVGTVISFKIGAARDWLRSRMGVVDGEKFQRFLLPLSLGDKHAFGFRYKLTWAVGSINERKTPTDMRGAGRIDCAG